MNLANLQIWANLQFVFTTWKGAFLKLKESEDISCCPHETQFHQECQQWLRLGQGWISIVLSHRIQSCPTPLAVNFQPSTNCWFFDQFWSWGSVQTGQQKPPKPVLVKWTTLDAPWGPCQRCSPCLGVFAKETRGASSAKFGKQDFFKKMFDQGLDQRCFVLQKTSDMVFFGNHSAAANAQVGDSQQQSRPGRNGLWSQHENGDSHGLWSLSEWL